MIRYRHRLLFKSFYDNFINFKILTLYIYIYIHIGKNRQSRARPCSSLANTRYRTEFLRNLLNRYSEDSFRAHKICSLMYFSLLFFPVQHGTSYRTIIRYGYVPYFLATYYLLRKNNSPFFYVRGDFSSLRYSLNYIQIAFHI